MNEFLTRWKNSGRPLLPRPSDALNTQKLHRASWFALHLLACWPV